MFHNPRSPLAIAGDAVAIGIIPSVWMGYLPYIAYLVTIVWGSCQIYSWFINKNYKPKDPNG